jgi:hypothetical protein
MIPQEGQAIQGTVQMLSLRSDPHAGQAHASPDYAYGSYVIDTQTGREWMIDRTNARHQVGKVE